MINVFHGEEKCVSIREEKGKHVPTYIRWPVCLFLKLNLTFWGYFDSEFFFFDDIMRFAGVFSMTLCDCDLYDVWAKPKSWMVSRSGARQEASLRG